MKRRLFYTITAIQLMTQAVIASPEGNWNSFRNNSWNYSGDNVEVTSAADLAQLAYLVTNGINFNGKTLTLGADIDMGAHYWSAIGSNNNSFNGTFDGAGHTISNLNIELTYDRQGLFAYLDGGAVKNVTLASGSISGGAGTGAIVGYNSHGTIENCHVLSAVSITITNSSASWFGGLVGYSSGTIAGCTSAATVSSSGSSVGGIVGRNTGTVKHSLYLGTTVSGGSEAGAITGDNTGTLTCNFYTEELLTGVSGADVSTNNGAVRGYSYPKKPDEAGSLVSTYGTGTYTGIAVYDGGLHYNGLYYISTNITWWGIRAGADGTSGSPYLISTVSDLNLLSQRVAAGNNYADTYFKMDDDIDYSSETVTDGANYVPVGSSSHTFNGFFNGGGHTISGISIAKNDNTGYQGVFGYVDGEGWIMNLVLANSTIKAYQYSAGIVGYFKGILIDNCHVLGDVSILSNGDDGNHFGFGGIVGRIHSGSVTDCSSAATVSGGTAVGGIVGDVLSGGAVADCLALGATLTGTGVGVICGQTSSDTEHIVRNNYSACTVYSTATSNALKDDVDNTTFLEQVAKRNTFLGTLAAHKVALAGRTLYKDGSWNTLCLPFGLTSFAGTPLEGATVKKLSTTSFADGTLTLNFSEDLTAIDAGKPYIVKWTKPDGYVAYNGTNAATCSDIVSPVFSGVTISSTAAETEGSDWVDFVGTYKPAAIYGEDKTMLYLGADNKLYYPNDAMTIGACRAYFRLNGITAGTPNDQTTNHQTTNTVRAFELNFGDDNGSAGVSPATVADGGVRAPGWFTPDGRKLGGKPSQKGVYIYGGRTVVIK